MSRYLIAPSLLSADFACLGAESDAVLKAGADMLHLDVMDNHYVPNLTVGPLVCAALRKHGINAPIDVHIMAKPVDDLIVQFAKAGASHITIHPDSTTHLDRSLALIRQHGCKAGVALNPATGLDCLDYQLDNIDLILVMSVNPGFAGQAFIPSSLEKIKHVQERVQKAQNDIIIAVDGGIKTDNIAAVAKAGATMFIAGSAIFNTPDYAKTIQTMREQLA
jgi:ribulose-phosphate 3-epimerase